MRYLLDTNIISDLVRNPKGKVAQSIVEGSKTFHVRIGCADHVSLPCSVESG